MRRRRRRAPTPARRRRNVEQARSAVARQNAAAKPQRKASKCDICKGYEQANCVYNCPQGAIIRVDPNEYFEELHRTVDLVSMANNAE